MRLITLLILALSITALAVGQVQPTKTKPPAKTQRRANGPASPARLKPVTIEKWGVRSISLPAVEMEQPETTEDKNNDVSWTTYSLAWKGPARSSEGLFTVRTWNTDFPKVTGLSAAVATPEFLMSFEHSKDLSGKNSGEIEDASVMEVDGVKGNFFQGLQGGDKNRVMAGWSTYRYYQNHAQRISIVFTGPRTELGTYMTIMQSIRLTHEP
jgi:hypothetical protein